MIVRVKDRVLVIEHYIGLVQDAMNHHECSEEKYQAYMIDMKDLLTRCVEKLKKDSTNEKLIAKYEKKVCDLFKDWN